MCQAGKRGIGSWHALLLNGPQFQLLLATVFPHTASTTTTSPGMGWVHQGHASGSSNLLHWQPRPANHLNNFYSGSPKLIAADCKPQIVFGCQWCSMFHHTISFNILPCLIVDCHHVIILMDIIADMDPAAAPNVAITKKCLLKHACMCFHVHTHYSTHILKNWFHCITYAQSTEMQISPTFWWFVLDILLFQRVSVIHVIHSTHVKPICVVLKAALSMLICII